ncbi:MAG: hypothetical protein JW864_14575 [Spirochaetes bacterium]|nr:hypothetical protein [Spirochaetota bacterium]
MDAADNQNTTSQTKNYHILKGRFKSNSLNFYGLFLFIFNSRRELDISHILVSTFSSAYDLEPFFGWEQYEEFIVNAKWKGNYNPNMTVSIEDYFKKIAADKDGQVGKLQEYMRDYDYDNIDAFMFDIINRIIHDKNLILETNVQEASESEFRQAKENRARKAEKSKDSGKQNLTDDEGVTLSIQLILAPVSGKPIYELKIGDVIMCKILPNTDRANYFIDLLDLRIENMVKPAPCKVIDIKSESKSDPLEILTEIGPGIYGKCIEDERQVKLRMYDPAVDGKQMSKEDIPNLKKDDAKKPSITNKIALKRSINFSKILYITIGILIILSLIVISFYLAVL